LGNDGDWPNSDIADPITHIPLYLVSTKTKIKLIKNVDDKKDEEHALQT
jgi:hypothetical protein